MTKNIEPNVVEMVLSEISQERKTAHEDLDKTMRELTDRVNLLNEKYRPVQQAALDAEDDFKAHARFKGKVAQNAFDDRERELTITRTEALTAREAASKDAQADIAPLQEKLKTSQEKCRELAREWQSHLRMAKAAQVDVAKFWTPEVAHVPAQDH